MVEKENDNGSVLIAEDIRRKAIKKKLSFLPVVVREDRSEVKYLNDLRSNISLEAQDIL